MQVKGFRAALLGAATVGELLLSGTAHAALQDRDLDGNGQVDAFYDTDLDITWLRDANVNGAMDWHSAVTWADSFAICGHGNWRLPTVYDLCTDPCTTGEFGHLWYVELGNTHGSLTNSGGFQNIPNFTIPYYWTSREVGVDDAFLFDFARGERGVAGKFNSLFAMAVTDGDVGLVPEPQTYALMLAGLAGLAIARRLQRR